MDVGGALVALVILLPMLVGVAVMIKCVSRGPVLFRQQRYGLGGKPFSLWKFRTVKTSEAAAQHHCHVTHLMANDAPLRKLDRELALIWGGAMLRKLGLDELPQLVNVLKGEMSLVGPRPDVLPIERYQAWQRDRFHVLPGITGLWQVSGKNHTTFSTMMSLDIAYIKQRSLRLDIMILLRTIPAVLSS
jgi:lipopolysaccharide/colanic/teichoic acid biosynthesis glycosyltransferase